MEPARQLGWFKNRGRVPAQEPPFASGEQDRVRKRDRRDTAEITKVKGRQENVYTAGSPFQSNAGTKR
jgi:hypothetical protein